MAVHLPVMYIAGCSGCVRITERHHRHVNYSRIVALGIYDEWFSSHGGDGWYEIIIKEGSIKGMFKRVAAR